MHAISTDNVNVNEKKIVQILSISIRNPNKPVKTDKPCCFHRTDWECLNQLTEKHTGT